MNIEYRLYIQAPVTEVFHLVYDKELQRLWMVNLVETRALASGDGGSAVGAKFCQTIQEGNRRVNYAGAVIAYDPLRHVGLTIGNGQFTMQVDYRFVADAEQTRLDYRAQMIQGTWFMRLTGKLFASFTRRILYHQMRRLKAVAEARQNARQLAEDLLAA